MRTIYTVKHNYILHRHSYAQHFLITHHPSIASSPDAPPSFSPVPLQSFYLQAVTESEVLKELLKLDPKKTSGSDGLDPFFSKVPAPISNIFNLSLLSGDVSIAWKAATVRPSFKVRNQPAPNCYRPISILPCLSKVLEKLVISTDWLS